MESFKFTIRDGVFDFDGSDFGARGADAEFAVEALEFCRWSGGQRFDATVDEVAHPAD